jgi:hypothetical protein
MEIACGSMENLRVAFKSIGICGLSFQHITSTINSLTEMQNTNIVKTAIKRIQEIYEKKSALENQKLSIEDELKRVYERNKVNDRNINKVQISIEKHTRILEDRKKKLSMVNVIRDEISEDIDELTESSAFIQKEIQNLSDEESTLNSKTLTIKEIMELNLPTPDEEGPIEYGAKCPACLDIISFEDTVITHCGHTICRQCSDNWFMRFNKQELKNCPTCNQIVMIAPSKPVLDIQVSLVFFMSTLIYYIDNR